MRYPRWLPYPGAVVNALALLVGLFVVGSVAAIAAYPILWLWQLGTLISGAIAIWWAILTVLLLPVFLLAKLHQSVWWLWQRLVKNPVPYTFAPPRQSWLEGFIGLGIGVLSVLAIAFWTEPFGFTKLVRESESPVA